MQFSVPEPRLGQRSIFALAACCLLHLELLYVVCSVPLLYCCIIVVKCFPITPHGRSVQLLIIDTMRQNHCKGGILLMLLVPFLFTQQLKVSFCLVKVPACGAITILVLALQIYTRRGELVFAFLAGALLTVGRIQVGLGRYNFA